MLAVAAKSANCLTTTAILYPRVLASVGTGTLSAGSAGGGTLGTLLAYDVTGCFIQTTGGTGGSGAGNQARKIVTYTTSTGAFTVAPNWETTPDATTTYSVLLPEGVTLGMLRTLNPTTAGNTLTVTSNRALSDVDTIKTNPVVNAGTITFPTTATLASTTNITAGTITTVTTVTNQLAAAAIATGVWQDATAGDFTAALSIGKSIMNGVALGTGLTVARVTLVDTTTTNTDMRGTDSAALAATALSTVTWTGTLATNLTTLAGHDPGATLGTSTLTQTQVTGGAYNVQSASCVLGDARIANLDASVLSRMATYTQPTGFLTANFPSDPADQSLIIAATDALLAAISALNNITAASVWAAAGRTLTTATNITSDGATISQTQLARLDADISSRTKPADTQAAVTLVTTTTNLTNAPTAGDFTATMKTSLGTAVGTAQTGDSYAIVNSGTFGNAAIKGYVDDIGVAGAGLTALGDTRIANLDATVTSRSTLTQTQVTGGAYSVQSTSCVLGDARIANLDATVSSRGTGTALTAGQVENAVLDGLTSGHGVAGSFGLLIKTDLDATISSRGTSTLTQTQVTGGAYSVQSASCVLGDARIAYLSGDAFVRLGAPVGASVSVDVAAVKTDTGNLITRIPAALFAGVTSLAQWMGLLAGKQSGNSTARTEVRATGAGSGTFDETTDSQEALRDRGDAAWGVAGNVTVGGYAAGQDPATLVLDATTAAHATVGTIGKAIGTTGATADPLTNAVPGSYAAGTAGFALGRIGTAAINVTLVSPVSDTGLISLVRGDSYYSADGRAIEFTDSGDTWPTLTSATGVFTAFGPHGQALSVAITVVVATGSGKKVRVELSATQTLVLTDDRYSCEIVMTLSNGHAVTLVTPTMNVTGEV